MNKKEAVERLKFYREHTGIEDLDEALDFAIKELSKPEKFNYEDELMAGLDRFVSKFSKYSPAKSEISNYLPEQAKASFRIPPFAWTCTCCWEPTEPQHTLCKKHYNSWLSSRWARANYRWLVNIDSPMEVRDWYNIGDIYYNRWRCPKCSDIIESLNHYDYQKCSCGHSFIDGGSDYSRRNPDLIDMTIYFNSIWKLPEVTTLEQ